MHIRQIPKSSVNTERTWGKWYCGDANEEGTVHRYLHPDGSWKNYAHYFDNEAQIQEALKIGISPDFTETTMEKCSRLRENIWIITGYRRLLPINLLPKFTKEL